jgi:predicted HTH transcriptional regulator
MLRCGIPAGSWKASPRRLKTSKVSRRRNPLIADLLRRIHLIEAWGRGIPLIIEKAPQARFSEIAGVFITEFPRPQAAGDSVTKSQPRFDATGQVSEEVKRLLAIVGKEMSRQEIQSALALRGRGNFEARYLNPALEAAFIERTIPNKPDSSHKKTTSQKKAGNSQPQLIIQPILNAEF